MLKNDLLEDTNILLKNKQKFIRLQLKCEKQNKKLLSNIDKLLVKNDSFKQMLDEFQKPTDVEKPKTIDENFLDFISKNKQHVTSYKTSFKEKMLLF